MEGMSLMIKKLPSGRCGELDFWKFICCIIIVIHHSYQFFGKRIYFNAGSMCVEFFFIVSGLLMAASAARKNEPFERDKIGSQTVSFIFHKIKGFLSYYIFSVIICLAVRAVGDGFRATFWNSESPLVLLDFLFLSSSGLDHYYIYSASWYLSAMLIAMMVIYPLLRYNRDLYLNVIAPISAIVIYAVIFKTDGYIGAPDRWMLFTTKGVFRAVAGLNLGGTAYALTKRLEQFNFGRFGKFALAFVQLFMMAGAMLVIYKDKYKLTTLVIIAFFVCAVVSMSKKSLISPIFNNTLCSYLGKLSMTVYLCHQTAANFMNYAMKKFGVDADILTRQSRLSILFIYVIISVILGIVCLHLCDAIKKYITRRKSNKTV